MRNQLKVLFLCSMFFFMASSDAEEMKLPDVETIGRGVTLLWEGPGDRPVVALTFDDGPISGKTEPILDLLHEAGVPATFFVLGENAERNTDLLQRMVREGHEIGNHTYSHPYLTKVSNTKVREEIKSCQRIVEEAVGYSPRFFRPPYGAANLTTMSILSSQNLTAVFWSVDPQDWRGGTGQEIVADISSHLDNGAIILLHERSPHTAESVPKIIETVRERGFRFVTLGEMFGYSPLAPSLPATKSAVQTARLEPSGMDETTKSIHARPVPTPQVVMIGGSLPETSAHTVSNPVAPQSIVPASPRPVGATPIPDPVSPLEVPTTIHLEQAPPATATPTPTESPTETSSHTPTYTPTDSPTHTSTAMPTATSTETPTPTATETSTSTATSTATSTWTFTATPSPTVTATHSPTDTMTSTPSPTFTSSPTPTMTPTPTQTPSPTHTFEDPRTYRDYQPVELRRLEPIDHFRHRFIVDEE